MLKQKLSKIPLYWRATLMIIPLIGIGIGLVMISSNNPLVNALSDTEQSIAESDNQTSTPAELAKQAEAKAKQAETQKAAAAVAATATATAAAAKIETARRQVRTMPVVNPPAPTISIGASLYANPSSNVANGARAWAAAHTEDAGLMGRLANTPMAQWFGDWNGSVQSDVNGYVSAATSAGKLPVLVAYNIPQRDCGSYSAGGAGNGDAYKSWLDAFAAGIGQRKAVVILEPDALAGMDCLSGTDQMNRQQLISYAVQTLRNQTEASIYIDAGHSGWHSATTMAGRLKSSGIANASGFSLNVSNFYSTASNTGYGQQLSGLIGGKHFVIDTSRNGGSVAAGEWCNPASAALGASPTTQTGNSLLDAYLWIKNPGESDGQCGATAYGTTAPSAGSWWGEYALMIGRAAGW